jgi:hypothetical protein
MRTAATPTIAVPIALAGFDRNVRDKDGGDCEKKDLSNRHSSAQR